MSRRGNWGDGSDNGAAESFFAMAQPLTRAHARVDIV
jgi:hypothetical protein